MSSIKATPQCMHPTHPFCDMGQRVKEISHSSKKNRHTFGKPKETSPDRDGDLQRAHTGEIRTFTTPTAITLTQSVTALSAPYPLGLASL